MYRMANQPTNTKPDRSPIVDQYLRRWSDELIDLSKRNRLLHFKHLRSGSFEFDQDAKTVLSGLDGRGRSKGWGFFIPESEVDENDSAQPPPKADELVVDPSLGRDGAAIARGLKNLAAKSTAEFLDSGLWVLYLGLGTLHWSDGDQDIRSPLYLLPVALEKVDSKPTWRLVPSDDGEPALNPSLSVALQQDFDIELPNLDDLESEDVDTVLSAIRQAVSGQQWTVEENVVLTSFSFQKEVIYRDIKANEREISEHPMIRLLAEGPSSDSASEVRFDPEDEEGLDDRFPPEDLGCILDADVTQRQCVLAARQGRSFVMDGPPGTGKSQTIANIIAQLIHDGKSVLFVSEKAAALEVVQNRLAKAGLDPFVLALHSHKATRKAVAQELGKAVHEKPSAQSQFTDVNRSKLETNRRQLTEYAIALNQQRTPLHLSLHDVIGRIAALENFPSAPGPEGDFSDLTAQEFAQLSDRAAELGRNWGPVGRGDGFIWRDLAEFSHSAPEVSILLDQLVDALRQLEDSSLVVREDLRLPSETKPSASIWLSDLIELMLGRPTLSSEWLTADGGTEIIDRARCLADLTESNAAVQAQVADQFGASATWRDIEPSWSSELEAAKTELGEISPHPPAVAELTSSEVLDLKLDLERLTQAIASSNAAVTQLASSFEVAGAMTFDLANRLAQLVELAQSPTKPLASWLEADGRAKAQEAAAALFECLHIDSTHRANLANWFTEDVLNLDLDGLTARFDQVHKGLFRALRSQYRADKQMLAGATTAGQVTPESIERLAEARQWQQARRHLEETEARYASSLGDYYEDRRHVDFERIEAALTIADKAITAAEGDVSATALARLIGSSGSLTNEILQAGSTVQSSLIEFRSDGLTSRHAPWLLSELEEMPLPAASTWLVGVSELATEVARVLVKIDALASEKLTVNGALALTETVNGIRADSAAIDAELAELQPFLGNANTHWTPTDLRASAEWVAKTRKHFDGSVPKAAAELIAVADYQTNPLQTPLGNFKNASNRVLSLFENEQQNQICVDLDCSFDDARELLAELRQTVGDIEEWRAYSEAKRALSHWGLESVIEYLHMRRFTAPDVAPALERGVLRRWAAQLIEQDSRLTKTRASDRDELRRSFRELDRALILNAAASVINSAAERRPTLATGGAGLIKQQAELKRRHKPVRDLLTNAGQIAQRLKPCFMMSPLSVSQFLPPTLRFDVVIFDEASQVREADAVCSVYRGDQLIVAGDQKQLPPTSFFDRMEDSDESTDDAEMEIHDFESVLDRCKAQGLVELPLNWHYRSKHEGLITYSNHSFYNGRLHTFPGAVSESDELGVAFFKVSGTYRRGSTRDNPVEAAKVVDRILFHRRHHPAMTVGVVTLSSAQQAAVEAEIERRLDIDPELRELVTDDRLSGFFVKNLESVQGDERDVIILTIGYGPDEAGKLTMNFGPLNRAGGERRLNVAVTRARQRVEVVASIAGSQIVSETPSVRHLARYLDYAERGYPALALDLEQSSGDAESPFEEEVIRVIQELGYEPVPQVGVAGYRVDIGVRHPSALGSFAIGIECDGATYHSSKVARDRDRLRQDVLEGLGWTIHRIWSTAWFFDREAQEKRLQSAIESAIAGRKDATEHAKSRESVTAPVVILNRVDLEQTPSWTVEYREPVAKELPQNGLEFTDPKSRTLIAEQVQQLAADFGPIHYEAALRAVRATWGLGRSGQRIREAFDLAVRHCERRDGLLRQGDFLAIGGADLAIRVPRSVDGARRPVKEIPMEERRLVILKLLADAGPTPREELRLAWTRLFGWARTGTDIENAFDDEMDKLIRTNKVQGGELLELNDHPPTGELRAVR